VVLNRRKIDLFDKEPNSHKLKEVIVNLDDLENAENKKAIEGCKIAFCTMGLGQPSKHSKDEFYKVDVVYATAFAKLCYSAGVKHISLLTSYMADKNSKLDYTRWKGEVEQNYIDLGFDRVSCFQPSLLVTKDIRYGFQDRVVQFAFPKISWILPSAMHEITVEDLGTAMQINAELPENEHQKVERLTYKDFVRLVKSVAQLNC